MGGYNTLIEAISLNKSIVVYNKHFMSGNEEQSIRLKLFEKHGLLVSISNSDINEGKLITKVMDSLEKNKKNKSLLINLNGAIETTKILKNIIAKNIN